MVDVSAHTAVERSVRPAGGRSHERQKRGKEGAHNVHESVHCVFVVMYGARRSAAMPIALSLGEVNTLQIARLCLSYFPTVLA